jgi:hypothetical protein
MLAVGLLGALALCKEHYASFLNFIYLTAWARVQTVVRPVRYVLYAQVTWRVAFLLSVTQENSTDLECQKPARP